MNQDKNILVMHPDGTFYARRKNVEHLADNIRGYWRDPAKRILVIIRSNDDRPNPGYEYGGSLSLDRTATRKACDILTHQVIDIPIEIEDRTQIPVRQAGGSTVMQLHPLRNRRSTRSVHSPNNDKLQRRQPAQRKSKRQTATPATT